MIRAAATVALAIAPAVGHAEVLDKGPPLWVGWFTGVLLGVVSYFLARRNGGIAVLFVPAVATIILVLPVLGTGDPRFDAAVRAELGDTFLLVKATDLLTGFMPLVAAALGMVRHRRARSA